MSESTSKQIEKPNMSKWKETVAGIGGCLLYLVFALGGLTLLVLLLRGVGWITENVYPWTILAAAIALFAVVPISLLLSIFRKSRGIGSIGLLISSYVIGLSLWVWSLIVAYSLAGTFWLIVGIVLAGIGVVPIAFIAALLARDWSIAGQIFISATIVIAIRWFSLFLSSRTTKEDEKIADEFIRELTALEEAQEITAAYSQFLSKGAPIIADAKLLPHRKAEIKRALLIYEQHLCDTADEHVASGQSEGLEEIDRLLNAVGACSMSLNSYTDIEPQDEEDVSYFNSYDTINDVPEEEQAECLKVMVKYMSKGMAEEMPESTEMADSSEEKA